MKKHFDLIKDGFFKAYEPYLKNMRYDVDPESVYYGTINPFSYDGIHEQMSYIAYLPPYLLAYYLPDTKYYRNEEMIDKAIIAMKKHIQYMNDDGTLDFRMTNFHDPAQTAFGVRYYFIYIELINKCTQHSPKEEELFSLMLQALKLHCTACARFGFHTPNHRWVITSALALGYKYTGDREFLDAMNGFLSEGIDCDENGEYTERSAGMYNMVCNHAFINLYMATGDDKFLDYPRRNLKLSYSFAEPDGTMMSLNSLRVDSAQKHQFIEYYPYYLFMAVHDRDSRFAYIADKFYDYYDSQRIIGSYCYAYCDILMWYLIYPEFYKNEAETISVKPDPDRSVYLPDSGIARVYKPSNNMTVSIMRTRQPQFLKIQKGSQEVRVRFAGAFFGDPHSQFRAREMYLEDGAYRLVCDEKAGYRSRFDTPPETSDWHKMDHSKRHMINIQSFHTEITVRVVGDDEVQLKISSTGCEHIPTKLEFIMAPGGKLDSDSLTMMTKPNDYAYLKSGEGKYSVGGVTFTLSEGFYKHCYGADMRGSMPLDPDRFTIAMTSETPEEKTVTVKIK